LDLDSSGALDRKEIWQFQALKDNSPLTDVNASWDIILFESLAALDWSEYTLYWVYACKARLVDTRHYTGKPTGARLETNLESKPETNPTTQLYPYAGFRLDSSHTAAILDNAKAVFFSSSSARCLFGVVQSIAGVEPLVVVGKLLPFFQNTQPAG